MKSHPIYFFLKPRKSYSTLLDQWPQPWAEIKDLPWPRDLVTFLPQLHSKDKITCLQPVVWAVNSVRSSSVMLESCLETTILIFTTGKRRKGELKFRVESTQQGGSDIQLLEIKQRMKLAGDSPVLSASHLVEEIIKTRTKIQLWTLLLLSCSFQRVSLDFPLQNWAYLSLYSTASQKVSENLKSVIRQDSTRVAAEKLSLLSNTSWSWQP